MTRRAGRRTDHAQGDLLAWTPPQPVKRFPAETIRAASLGSQISRAVGRALKDCGKSREQVAAAMSAYLGEAVTQGVLDKYASEAADDHIINVVRFVALIEATKDRRLVQFIAELFGWAVVEDRHVRAIELAAALEAREAINRDIDALQSQGWPVSDGFHTPSELAAMTLPDLPRSERGVQLLADRTGWRRPETEFPKNPNGLWRRRVGRGGGYEYRAGILPLRAQAALSVREAKSAGQAHEKGKPEAAGKSTDRDGVWRAFDAKPQRKKDEARRRQAALDAVLTMEKGWRETGPRHDAGGK